VSIRSSTLLLAASLLVALTCGPAKAAEFATREEAVALVKKAVTLIKEQGQEKAYTEFKQLRAPRGSFSEDYVESALALNFRIRI
jgi:cytochrome c